MRTDEFDYHLPDTAIAQRPAPRGEARLLVLDAPAAGRHRRVQDLPNLLRPDDLLVVNDTRVIPARLFARRRDGGGRVELLLVERVGPVEWDVLVKPGRKARPGTVLELRPDEAPGEGAPGEGAQGEESGGGAGERGLAASLSAPPLLTAEMIERPPPAGSAEDDGRKRVRFSEPVEPHLERLGHVPLPPYIKRADEAADHTLYQTVFAREPGAIAAPTAGLHFDAGLLAALAARGIERVPVTLHVGIGTFKPVTAATVGEHRMERERYDIPATTAAAIAEAKRVGRRVVAIGTTVVRTLEGAALAANLEAAVPAGPGSTNLFIVPGFRFRVVDALLTNFHLPRSTLLMLVAAFAAKDRVMAAYAEAVREGYRFYSYGDAMLAARPGRIPRS
ncbi:MAG TPA: tRNA preQ1(34) S-adenosylmethionine ribosyltransferase-isomerase QueA [Thermoanaerobaculia bacterium]|nr:tRNA preQ1(34) S-adenosylmethionine ribosyltransferase-isomerase QueA [Thermoanaerobaculia bacterium]